MKVKFKIIVSRLCKALFYAKNVNTLYNKEKFEKEAGIGLSEEAWRDTCSFHLPLWIGENIVGRIL